MKIKMKTTHRYVGEYPIEVTSEKLILGTIHPHNHHEFETQFFYGSRNSLWRILAEAFPTELPFEVDDIVKFLKKKRISISDTVLECERESNSALDEDMKPTVLNLSLIEEIKRTAIHEIFFTSGFAKNNAFKLFYVDILKLPLTTEVRNNRGVILDESVFGRPVKLTVLFSPSGGANTGISRSKIYLAIAERYSKSKRPIHDFRVDYYKQKFQ